MEKHWLEKQLQQKLALIKGLISVEGNIIFGNTGFTKDSVVFYGSYFGGDEPKSVNYSVEKEHIELLKEASGTSDIIEIYKNIGYFSE